MRTVQTNEMKLRMKDAIELVKLAVDELKKCADDNGECYGCHHLDLITYKCSSGQGRVLCNCETNNMWTWKYVERLKELEEQNKEN